jgi:hypothetical protein
MDSTLERLTLRRSSRGRCPSCGRPVPMDEEFVKVKGRAYHVSCVPEKVEERAYRQLYNRRRDRVRLRESS